MKMKPENGHGYMLFLYIFLGALAAFPPLVTDMPALPEMTVSFHTSASAIQLGLGAGQLMFGPLSD